jgi:iron complex transport system substrate-binding protein
LTGLFLSTLVLAAAAGSAPTVIDDTGARVELDAPARRIVTLAPHATELVYAAGAGGRLVAVESASDHPPAARELPRIGGAGALDRERLLELAPDLVVAWHSGNRPDDLDWLARQGVAVYRTEPVSLDDVARAVRDLGELAGTRERAEQAAAAWETALAHACRPGSAPRRALVVLWDRPLMVYGGAHWINEVLARAGYVNVFDDVRRGVFSPSPEAVLAAGAEVGLTATDIEPERLGVGHVRSLPEAASRPSPRLAGVIRALCAR